MRSNERWLEDRDQIGIGRTILMFRSGEAGTDANAGPQAPDTKPVLLAACSLVFLFRALAASLGQGPNKILQNQILRLVGDLIPTREGILILGASAKELHDKFVQETASPFKIDFTAGIARVCEEGAFEDEDSSMVGVPLYLAGVLGGALLIRVHDREGSRLTAHLETLTAVASLASIGFEANHEVETLKAENALLQEQIAINTGIVGDSPIIRKLLELIARVAPRDTTVLITGESGTGKELIARALHQKSLRRERPFIAVNCAALSEALFESELFGHEKGSFTGAISLKRGRFELAQGGTIFLDEVGELAERLQAKLLRVLQQREFERVGGTQAHPLDIRVIAATNRDLAVRMLAKEGSGKTLLSPECGDLDSPPLRDRKEDIPILANTFCSVIRNAANGRFGLSREVEEMVMQYAWPGNVRELENAMERAVVLGVSEWVLPEDLPETLLECRATRLRD